MISWAYFFSFSEGKRVKFITVNWNVSYISYKIHFLGIHSLSVVCTRSKLSTATNNPPFYYTTLKSTLQILKPSFEPSSWFIVHSISHLQNLFFWSTCLPTTVKCRLWVSTISPFKIVTNFHRTWHEHYGTGEQPSVIIVMFYSQ
jgi:hypothetical protein